MYVLLRGKRYSKLFIRFTHWWWCQLSFYKSTENYQLGERDGPTDDDCNDSNIQTEMILQYFNISVSYTGKHT